MTARAGRHPDAGPARCCRTYQRAWLPSDLVAGLVLTAVLVPVGMGYAEAAGLPAITGLYATIVPLLVYALLGPSRILVLGPDSSLAAIIAATVVPLAGGDPERAVALAGGLALISGAFGIAFGLLHLGLADRPPVEADPDRLPQWHRPDGVHRAAAQAVRVLDRRRGRRSPRPQRVRRRRGRRARRTDRPRDRTPRAGRHARRHDGSSRARSGSSRPRSSPRS